MSLLKKEDEKFILLRRQVSSRRVGKYLIFLLPIRTFRTKATHLCLSYFKKNTNTPYEKAKILHFCESF